MTAIEIRKLVTMKEVEQIQQLEQEVWGMTAIPTHQTFTAATNGGLLLGAFDGDQIVGFSYSFPGFKEGEVYLCSHMLGVLPSEQHRGIGNLLKEHQCQIAREMGYSLLTWTFDPLESRNAYLNFSKLKGISSCYLENCYGEMTDGLNKGLPSDRLKIEWWINRERVTKNWQPLDVVYERPFTIEMRSDGYPKMTIALQDIDPTSEGIEIAIPKHIQQIKQQAPDLALDWRMKIREAFQFLFDKGFAIVNLNKTEEDICYYQFIKRAEIPLKHKGEL